MSHKSKFSIAILIVSLVLSLGTVQGVRAQAPKTENFVVPNTWGPCSFEYAALRCRDCPDDDCLRDFPNAHEGRLCALVRCVHTASSCYDLRKILQLIKDAGSAYPNNAKAYQVLDGGLVCGGKNIGSLTLCPCHGSTMGSFICPDPTIPFWQDWGDRDLQPILGFIDENHDVIEAFHRESIDELYAGISPEEVAIAIDASLTVTKRDHELVRGIRSWWENELAIRAAAPSAESLQAAASKAGSVLANARAIHAQLDFLSTRSPDGKVYLDKQAYADATAALDKALALVQSTEFQVLLELANAVPDELVNAQANSAVSRRAEVESLISKTKSLLAKNSYSAIPYKTFLTNSGLLYTSYVRASLESTVTDLQGLSIRLARLQD